MRIFYDFEFHENGVVIAPLSIGMVRENGDEYYAIFRNPMHIDRAVQSDWLRENVIPHLPIILTSPPGRPTAWRWNADHPDYQYVKPRITIAIEVYQFIRETEDVELWAWFAAYDHVTLAQLWGTMIDLPAEVPMHTMDLKQEAVRLGNPAVPEQKSGHHNALDDARHNMAIAEFLDDFDDLRYNRLRRFAYQLIALDTPGSEDRKTVTLNQIITSAKHALWGLEGGLA
jgi:hypothetical protein